MPKQTMLLIEDNETLFNKYKKEFENIYAVYPKEYKEFNLIKKEKNKEVKLSKLFNFIVKIVIEKDISFLSLDLNLEEFGFDDKKEDSASQTGLEILKLLYEHPSYVIRTLPILSLSQFTEEKIEENHQLQKYVFEHIHKGDIRSKSLYTYLEKENLDRKIIRAINIYNSQIISEYLNYYGDSIKHRVLIKNIHEIKNSKLISKKLRANKEDIYKDLKKIDDYIETDLLGTPFDKLQSEYNDNRIDINALILKEIKEQKNILIKALEEDSVVPYYQKIVDKNKQLVKYEVLARVEDENEKILNFFIFVDIAKFYSLLHRITKVMIEKSFNQLNKEKDKKHISINLDYDDLNKNKIDSLISILDKNLNGKSIDKNQITLEILEGAKQDKDIIDSIKKLKSQGYKIALDDFGIENSNLERLKALLEDECLDFIKIDGKFIKDINKCDISEHLLRAMVYFADKKNITIVVEFVKSKEVFDICKTIDSSINHPMFYQGFHFSEPKNSL